MGLALPIDPQPSLRVETTQIETDVKESLCEVSIQGSSDHISVNVHVQFYNDSCFFTFTKPCLIYFHWYYYYCVCVSKLARLGLPQHTD